MKRYIFALISDAVFIALCAFLTSFVLIRFFMNNVAAALCLSIAPAIAAGIATFFIRLSSKKKIILKNADSAAIKSLALHLTLLKKEELIKLLCYAYEGVHEGGNRIVGKEDEYFFLFSLSPVTADGVARIIRAKTDKRKVLLCCLCGEDGKALALSFDIKIVEIGEIYALLREKKLLPEKYICGNVKKKTALTRIRSRFNRKLCPSLFLSGCALLFFSLFTFYPVYYIAFGCALILCAAVCLFIRQSS